MPKPAKIEMPQIIKQHTYKMLAAVHDQLPPSLHKEVKSFLPRIAPEEAVSLYAKCPNCRKGPYMDSLHFYRMDYVWLIENSFEMSKGGAIAVCPKCRVVFGHDAHYTATRIDTDHLCAHCLQDNLVHALLYPHPKHWGKFWCPRKHESQDRIERNRVSHVSLSEEAMRVMRGSTLAHTYVEGIPISKVTVKTQVILEPKECQH